jgi:glycine hydroxymethyltransferase
MGTPAVTTRGFGVDEMTQLSGWIADILDNVDDETRINSVREQAIELCSRFPVYA